MEMTHYMELLATNQPWNLILFMAIPVILAETVAISELYLLITKNRSGWVASLSKFAGILGGIYFFGVFLYLVFTAILPITNSGTWRGPADIIAVGFYLLGVVPLVGIMLVDTGIIGKGNSEKLHATFVGIFLVVAHIAMIFGMLNPSILGYRSTSIMEETNSPMMDMEHRNM